MVDLERSDFFVKSTSGFRDLGASGVGWESRCYRRCKRRRIIGVANAEGLVGDLDDSEDDVYESSVDVSIWDNGGVGIDMYQGRIDCLKIGGHIGQMHKKGLF